MFALKKKKLLEADIGKLQGASMTLAKQLNALEGAAFNVETFNTLKTGASALEAVVGDL